MFGLDDSLFATVDHDTHKMRRAPLNGFFSVQSVRRLQPMVEERVDKWLERLRDLKRTGEDHLVLAVTSAFSNGKYM